MSAELVAGDPSPYRPPQVDLTARTAPHRMFTPAQMTAACLLAGVAAVAYMVCMNLRRGGETGPAWAAAGLFLFLVPGYSLLWHGWAVAGNPLLPLHLMALLIVYLVTSRAHGERLRVHLWYGGRVASWWAVLGVAVMASVVVVPVHLVTILLTDAEFIAVLRAAVEAEFHAPR